MGEIGRQREKLGKIKEEIRKKKKKAECDRLMLQSTIYYKLKFSYMHNLIHDF